jgi:hypothetical protein
MDQRWSHVLIVAGIALVIWGLSGLHVHIPDNMFDDPTGFPQASRIELTLGGVMIAIGAITRDR